MPLLQWVFGSRLLEGKYFLHRRSLSSPASDYTLTECHLQEERNAQLHNSENLKTRQKERFLLLESPYFIWQISFVNYRRYSEALVGNQLSRYLNKTRWPVICQIKYDPIFWLQPTVYCVLFTTYRASWHRIRQATESVRLTAQLKNQHLSCRSASRAETGWIKYSDISKPSHLEFPHGLPSRPLLATFIIASSLQLHRPISPSPQLPL